MKAFDGEQAGQLPGRRVVHALKRPARVYTAALRSKKRSEHLTAIPPFARFVAESGFYRLDLYPNQNRLDHKNLHRERDNCTVQERPRTTSKSRGFVRHARARQIGRGRLPFAAEVRATELDSGKETWGEIADLSKGGCYVRTRQPFSQGTLLEIEIRKQGVRFLTDATVAYTLEANGMGLSFVNVPANELSILEHWLSSARGTDRQRHREAHRSS